MKNESNQQISRSVEEAFAHIQQLVSPITEIESDVPLHLALDRILATDIVSGINVPAHHNAAMDGYAFHSSALSRSSNDGDIELSIVGKALAGKAWRGSSEANQCVQITTGAVMPSGCDTVVPSELVTLSHGSIRLAQGSIRAGDNRRLAGEDIAKGSVALSKGSLLSPAAMGLLASLGMPTAPVYRRLRVAYFSTGDEVLSLGEPPREGAIYDSNRYTMLGMLAKLGVEVVDLGVVADNLEALQATFHIACSRADVVITSGGVSVGEADHTKATMRQLGEVEFWRIAMRPGRPMAVGTLKTGRSADKADTASACVLFGLPGNPVAVMVTFLALVRPALLKMMGVSQKNANPLPMLQAKSTMAIRKKAGRTEYQRGIVRADQRGDLSVQVTGNQGSGVLSSMVQANGLIVLAHDQGDVAAGDTVSVMMFEGAM
jgi:molybdopterin molybdotransferase